MRIAPTAPYVLVATLLCAGAALGADLQFWNTTEFLLFQRGRWTWNVFGMARVRDQLSDAYDDRLGSVVQYDATRRVGLRAGYLRRWNNFDRQGMHQENRVYGSLTAVPVLLPVKVAWISQYERHIAIPGCRDFNQYKQRLDVERVRRRVSPFLYQELSLRRQGLVRSRTLAGLRWRLEAGTHFEIGYQFESLQVGGAWMPRHSIRTTLSLGALFKRPT